MAGQHFSPDVDPAIRMRILEEHAATLMTDVERARFYGLPEGCRIRERAKIFAPEKLVCGTNLWIGEGAVLDAMGGLEIGDNTQIGLGVMVWSHSSHKQAVRGETGTTRASIDYRPTKIGSNVFIAGPSVIAGGVTIGDRCIISPLSFVDRDLPPETRFSGSRRLHDLEAEVAQLREQVRALMPNSRK